MLNIEDPVPIDLYYTDRGKLLIIKLLPYALPEFLTVDKQGSIRVDESFKDKGYGHLRTAYDREIPTADQARKKQLETGRDFLFDVYLKAYAEGVPADTSLNAPDEEASGVKYIGDHLLPTVVLENRKKSSGGRRKLVMPLPEERKAG